MRATREIEEMCRSVHLRVQNVATSATADGLHKEISYLARSSAETPTVGPGKALRYTSSTPLKTEYGTMEGSFELEVQPAEGEPAEDEPRNFDARVGRFGLSMDGKPVKVTLELGA